MSKVPKHKFSTPFKTPQRVKGFDFMSQHSTPGLDVWDILPGLSQATQSSSTQASESDQALDIAEIVTAQSEVNLFCQQNVGNDQDDSGYHSLNKSELQKTATSDMNKAKQITSKSKTKNLVMAMKWNFKKPIKDNISSAVNRSKSSDDAKTNKTKNIKNKQGQRKIKHAPPPSAGADQEGTVQYVTNNVSPPAYATIKRKPQKGKEDLCYTPKKPTNIGLLIQQTSHPSKHSTPKRKFGFHKEHVVPDVSPIQQVVEQVRNMNDHQGANLSPELRQASNIYEFTLSPTSYARSVKRRQKLRKEVSTIYTVQ